MARFVQAQIVQSVQRKTHGVVTRLGNVKPQAATGVSHLAQLMVIVLTRNVRHVQMKLLGSALMKEVVVHKAQSGAGLTVQTPVLSVTSRLCGIVLQKTNVLMQAATGVFHL